MDAFLPDTTECRGAAGACRSGERALAARDRCCRGSREADAQGLESGEPGFEAPPQHPLPDARAVDLFALDAFEPLLEGRGQGVGVVRLAHDAARFRVVDDLRDARVGAGHDGRTRGERLEGEREAGIAPRRHTDEVGRGEELRRIEPSRDEDPVAWQLASEVAAPRRGSAGTGDEKPPGPGREPAEGARELGQALVAGVAGREQDQRRERVAEGAAQLPRAFP